LIEETYCSRCGKKDGASGGNVGFTDMMYDLCARYDELLEKRFDELDLFEATYDVDEFVSFLRELGRPFPTDDRTE
jgi:hypothetical protein